MRVRKILSFGKRKVKRTLVRAQYLVLSFLFERGCYKIITGLKYKYLDAVKEIDVSSLKRIKRHIEEYNLKRLKGRKKIRICFVLYNSSMWFCDTLFKKMEQGDFFDPFIVVADMKDGSQKNRDKMYRSAITFFSEKGYKVYGAREKSTISVVHNSDILFYLTPFELYQKEFDLTEMPLRLLSIYTPYSFMVASRENKFDLPVYYLSWKFFADTVCYEDLLKRRDVMDESSVVFCGFMRADEFLVGTAKTVENYWKNPSKERMHRIVYAPHHSVFNRNAGFSTFDQNYKFMLELAKKYNNRISWIVKPHPLLRNRIVSYGFMKDENEYDNYLQSWNKLPNARVVEDGSYVDILKTSDSMILDSVSFLAEYQFLHKPLLFLTRDTQQFNEFGKKLVKVLYRVKGNDYANIEKYIQNVVIGGKDIMREQRESFYDKWLEYYNRNGGMSASDYILNYLTKLIKGEDGK